jgi:hypothetical protein
MGSFLRRMRIQGSAKLAQKVNVASCLRVV